MLFDNYGYNIEHCFDFDDVVVPVDEALHDGDGEEDEPQDPEVLAAKGLQDGLALLLLVDLGRNARRLLETLTLLVKVFACNQMLVEVSSNDLAFYLVFESLERLRFEVQRKFRPA